MNQVATCPWSKDEWISADLLLAYPPQRTRKKGYHHEDKCKSVLFGPKSRRFFFQKIFYGFNVYGMFENKHIHLKV